MAAEDRLTFTRHDVALTFPGPRDLMTAHARATEWGIEYLWGALTMELRAQLEAGGCDRLTFQGAVSSAWRAWSDHTAGPVRLVLREGSGGHELLTEPGPDGEGAAVVHLVRAAFFLEYRWKGYAARLPMPQAAEGLDVWALLPNVVREQLEGEGDTSESINAALLAQAREAIAAGGGVPTVRLPVGEKKRGQPVALREWRKKAAP